MWTQARNLKATNQEAIKSSAYCVIWGWLCGHWEKAGPRTAPDVPTCSIGWLPVKTGARLHQHRRSVAVCFKVSHNFQRYGSFAGVTRLLLLLLVGRAYRSNINIVQTVCHSISLFLTLCQLQAADANTAAVARSRQPVIRLRLLPRLPE